MSPLSPHSTLDIRHSTLLLLLLVFPARAQYLEPATNPLFDDAALPSVYVTLAPANLARILAPGNELSDEEYPATFTFDDGTIRETVEEVGFRLRGNTSRHAAKKSFKVSFNTFVKGQKLFGIEKLNLNGEHNDPSIARAKLSWDLFRTMRVPASRANHVRLYINDQYFGLYLNVEHIDEQFLQSRFGGDAGSLYKCLWPADLTYRGDDPDAYRPDSDDRRPYDLHLKDSDDEGYADLAYFIDVLNNTPDALFPEAIERIFDVNAFLRVLAVDVAVGSWDDYWYNQNNFYLYYDPSASRFTFIPYDYDNTFGVWWDGIEPGVDWGERDVYAWGHRRQARPLADRILAVPAFRARYTFYLRRLLEGPFRPDVLKPRIDRLHGHIEDAAEEDPYRSLDYGYTELQFHQSYAVALGDHVPYGVKPYVERRYATALGQLDATDVAPILSDVRHAPAYPRPSDPITILAYVEDEDTSPAVAVRYRIDNGPETVLDLRDDGLHGDGAAGDGTYGTVLPPTGRPASVRYRLTGSDAARGTSTTWARTIRTGEGVAGLYVNEFMADNESTLADETGTFEDWIELYNGGPEAISLAGLYLTDDLDEPDQWALPDTVLPAGAFLLVWADGDPDEGPLHASFRLSLDGEAVGLFAAAPGGFAPVDTLHFGPQQADVSSGRMPDGDERVGPLPHPTPGRSNLSGPVAAEPVPAAPATEHLTAYPNPFADHVTMSWSGTLASSATVEIYDATGRRVRRLSLPPGAQGTLTWDGMDQSGRAVPPGVYFVRLDGGASAAVVRLR